MFEISRRDLVLSSAGAFAAFGLSKPIAFIGAAEAQQAPAAASFRKYKVGDIEVFSLSDGVWEKAARRELHQGRHRRSDQSGAQSRRPGRCACADSVHGARGQDRRPPGADRFRHGRRTGRRPEGRHAVAEHGRGRPQPEGCEDRHPLALPWRSHLWPDGQGHQRANLPRGGDHRAGRRAQMVDPAGRIRSRSRARVWRAASRPRSRPGRTSSRSTARPSW